MKLPTYQLFGSPSSQDVDVVFFVDQIPSIKVASQQSKQLGEKLGKHLGTAKAVNANLAVLGNAGHLIAVYKGTTDELNNALLRTYAFHDQAHPLQIHTSLKRDVGLKVLRCARVILSFLSRTKIRSKVKAALRDDLIQKLAVLETVQLSAFQDLGKHGGLVEFYKTAAFQLGQTLALKAQVELYTKEEIAEYFPELNSYLFRAPNQNPAVLQKYLHLFIQFAKEIQSQLYALKEYPYKLT